LENISFQNSDVTLHAVAAGPRNGRVVVLLHGFPEFWYGWHKQITPLANAGFRVIAPDQRGYNLSSKPAGVASYALAELVSDVISIADQLGQQKIFLAGHDWGAVVAWSTALLHPQRIAKLAVLNVPCFEAGTFSSFSSRTCRKLSSHHLTFALARAHSSTRAAPAPFLPKISHNTALPGRNPARSRL
jgi:pimeloyl-ACP methyl ester carboxylesterase